MTFEEDSSEKRSAGDFYLFHNFAAKRAGSPVLNVLSGADNVQLFHDSLMSAIAHTTLRQPPRDQDGNELRLVAGYLDKMIPNAMADHFEGRHYIAMNTALFVAVQEFAMFCFTQQDFFPDVGDPSMEASPPPLDNRVPGLWLLDFTSHGGSVDEHHGRTITPRGESRYNASIYLGLLMARFVWLHEFQHCFNGHVRLVQDTGRALYLNEIEEPLGLVGFQAPPMGDAGSRDAVQRSLELDADKQAFWACCQIQLAQRENIEGIAALDINLRLRLTLFGAYAMTWLFEEFQNYLDAKAGITHPDPYLRLQNIVAIAARHIEPIHEAARAANQDACGQFDTIQRNIPSIYATDELRSGTANPEVQESLENYEKEFASVADELERLRYNEQR
tara:strand:+ start:1199 stop:2368 length:1170 start_codon:yes stop_codon:yes gene_type:complete